MTTLQNFTGTLTGGELFEVVSPGNPSLGVNYNVNATTLAQNLLPLLPGQNPNTVLAGPASGSSTAIPAFRALVPLDLPGLVQNVVASSYVVATTDMNKLIVLSGNPGAAPPFTLSLSTASNYTSAFVVTLYNNNTVTRGWAIALNGVATFILWPLQTVQLFNDSNVWRSSPQNQPWVRNVSGVIFNVDNVNGSDSSANDGLGTGSGAFLTIANAFATVKNNVAQFGRNATIQLPATTATPITENVSMAGAMPPGVSLITIAGNATSPTSCQWVNSTTTNAAVSDYQSVTFNGIGFSGNGFSFVNASQFSIIDFFNCNFGANAGGTNAFGTKNTRINFVSGNSISGNCSTFVQADDAATVAFGSAPITVSGTANIGVFGDATNNGVVDFRGLSFAGNTSGLSGQKFQAVGGGVVIGDSGITWPSNFTNGSTSNGGLSDAGNANYNGSATVLAATPLVSGGTTGAGYTFFSAANLGMFAGTGVPTLAAATSALYLRNDAVSSTTRLYINTNGSTTWVGLTATG